MLLSKSCEYGVRAALFLAQRKPAELVPIREISDELNISFHFLTKILQTLTSAELVFSHKGPKGGVCLTKLPKDITLYDLIAAIDTDKVFTQCVLGLPGCGNQRPCPLHHHWAETREHLQKMFTETTLEHLATRMKNENLRLADDSFQKKVLKF